MKTPRNIVERTREARVNIKVEFNRISMRKTSESKVHLRASLAVVLNLYLVRIQITFF